MSPKERLDYFSIMAMQGFLNGDDDHFIKDNDGETTWSEDLADASVDLAKALIERIEKEKV